MVLGVTVRPRVLAMKPPDRLLKRLRECQCREICERLAWEIILAAACFEPESVLTYTLSPRECARVRNTDLELTPEEQDMVAVATAGAPSAGSAAGSVTGATDLLATNSSFSTLTSKITRALEDALLEPDACRAWERVCVKMLVCVVVSSRLASTTIGTALGITLTRKDKRAVEELEVECEDDGTNPVLLAQAISVLACRLSLA